MVTEQGKPAGNRQKHPCDELPTWATLVWVATPVALICFMLLVVPKAGEGHPLQFALAAAPFYGLVAFVVTTVIARVSKRPTSGVDVCRIVCWTVFGCGLGVLQCPGAGYFPAFYPQYTPMARACGGAVVVLSAAAVAAITLLYPAKRHYAPPGSE